MKKFRLAIALTVTVAVASFAAPIAAHAYGDGTPDTDPPAEEEVCNGLGGRMWGLCVAYCEAQDCPGSDHPSCEILRLKMEDLSGGGGFPCDGGPIG